MECIKGVLATLDPATIGKLFQCDGVQLGSGDMQACVKEQLGIKPEDSNATMDPSVIVEKLGACVDTTTGDIDLECIQGVLATLDPATIGKLAQCAGAGSIADMQACVEEQLGGGTGTGTPEDGNATMDEDTTSPGAFATTSGFMGFSVVALAVGLFY